MENRRLSEVRFVYLKRRHYLNDSDLYKPDLQNLLVGVSALKATDHRVVRSTRGDGEETYSSIRTGTLNATTTEDGDDD